MKIKYSPWLLLVLGCMTGQAAEVGSSAPSCQVPTLAGDAVIDPAAHAGKVVYLDFWASWCIPCAKSFPFLDQTHAKLKDQGFEVIAINLDEERQEALRFLEKHPVRFTIGADPMAKCPRLYQVRGMPTSYLIDRKGRIRQVHEGFKASDTTKILAQIESLLLEP